MSKNDGGPAYPYERIDFSKTGNPIRFGGMTLRDWFAGQALVGWAKTGWKPEEGAKKAYELADAMLEERSGE